MFSKGYKINERYEIVKTIGEGGMANVYLAIDLILDRKVAIKVLRGDLSNDEKFIRRFEREAWSVSNLSHQNIVEVYDVGEEDGQHYIVMEYIEGKTLKQLLKKRENLTVAEVIDIMSQLTEGISHAHEAYIIHRDIKPQNIMILDSGLIKITDFGIAMALNATQLTQTNSVMGSVHYIPPEQANGKGSTIKSDIYSMGIMMYELLTGSVPFKGDNAVEIALKHMKEKIPSVRKQNPTIPQSVENIVLKATAKNPRNRYDTALEMHDDIVSALDKENEKKITFEYPENDFDDVVTPTKKNKVEPIITTSKVLPTEPVETKEDEQDVREEKSSKVLRNVLIFFLISCIIGGIIFIIVSNNTVKTVKVPNLINMSIEDAIYKLDKLGLEYDIKETTDENVEEDNVIKTVPKAGSTRKEGSKIVLYKSIGGEFYNLENLVGKDYNEIKAKLELHKITVNIEKKEVDDVNEYKDKADIIIGQSPEYDENNEQKLTEGDSITLYIPNVVNVYPDMISEGWTLSSLRAFASEYEVSISVTDANNITIPSDEYDVYNEAKITYQSRKSGDPIIKGITCNVKIDAVYEKEVLDDVLP